MKALALPLAAAITATAHGAQKQPNIILFMVDDMGWQDTSVPFAPDSSAYNRMFLTPNMERLAASGVKFTQAYASAIALLALYRRQRRPPRSDKLDAAPRPHDRRG